MTAGREGAPEAAPRMGGLLDPEVKQTLSEINANLQAQTESKERERSWCYTTQYTLMCTLIWDTLVEGNIDIIS